MWDERNQAPYPNKDHMPSQQSYSPSYAIFSSYKTWIKHGILKKPPTMYIHRVPQALSEGKEMVWQIGRPAKT